MYALCYTTIINQVLHFYLSIKIATKYLKTTYQFNTKGKEIVCITSNASTQGEVSIIVQISRGQMELTSIYNSFIYAMPKITSVHPRYGPVSGGTIVTISGSELNVGNTENISITIAGEHCEIM